MFFSVHAQKRNAGGKHEDGGRHQDKNLMHWFGLIIWLEKELGAELHPFSNGISFPPTKLKKTDIT